MKTSIYHFLFFLLISIPVFSQTPQINSLSTYMEIADNSVSFGEAVIGSTSLKGMIVIELEDTVNLSKIHVKLGTSSGTSDLFSKAFDFDVNGTLADGTSYKREGFIVYLGIGNFIGISHYYSEAKLETSSGNFSTPVSYNN